MKRDAEPDGMSMSAGGWDTEPAMMRRTGSRHPLARLGLILVASVALVLSVGHPVHAGVSQIVVEDAAPTLTVDDALQILARNEALRAILPKNPALVRSALEAIMMARKVHGREFPQVGGEKPVFDPVRNPDLDALQRANPEAAHDLFLLIKKASQPSSTK